MTSIGASIGLRTESVPIHPRLWFEPSATSGPFLDRGEFRPLGRIFENLEYAFVYEAAEAAGIAPHVINGSVRLMMIAILAMTAARVVSAVMNPAGAESPSHPVLVLFPLMIGTVLVINGPESPAIAFPFISIGSAVLILLVVLSVARDRDMHVRRLSWLETVAMALLGAAAAMTYDLVYVAPPLAAGFILVRVVAAGHRPGFVLRTAALRRWLVLSVGFLAVFVPARLVIAGRCRNLECYSGSGVSFSPDVPGLTARRILTGAPPAGWSHTAEFVDQSGRTFDVFDLAANSLLAVLTLVIVAVAVSNGAVAARSATASGVCVPSWPRSTALLAGLGALTALLPALWASLSNHIQSGRPDVGEAWRDTLMVQVGWSFMIAAVIAAVVGAASRARVSRITVAVLVMVLCAGLALSLLTHARLAHIDRSTPLSSIVSQISESTVIDEHVSDLVDIAEANDRANVRRCALIDSYTVLVADPEGWSGGPRLRQELDDLMLNRYGRPFCDSTRLTDVGS